MALETHCRSKETSLTVILANGKPLHAVVAAVYRFWRVSYQSCPLYFSYSSLCRKPLCYALLTVQSSGLILET